MKVWYMAHPVAGDVPGNIARAKRWFRWLVKAVPGDVCVIAPWLETLEWCAEDDGDPAVRERAMQRNVVLANLCDAVVLVGGRVSAGMQREADAAKEVRDLTCLGEEPPGTYMLGHPEVLRTLDVEEA